jgi:hypothetical protein
MFSLLQADLASQRGQSSDRPLFEAQTFSLLTAWHSRSHAELAHIWLRKQLSCIVRSPRHAKRNARLAAMVISRRLNAAAAKEQSGKLFQP